ncbi:MAG: thioredoxin domain-containing protein [Verrucomicrobia bacterium]|nr:thioredoxin domain-containing protein [Verrucomicrobiota bacterium]
MSTHTDSPKHTNRLAQEKSPYLRQHMHNPVDWYPWSEAAFAKARAEGKPIFLSIGYSTCHWCHVMERESFENEELAKYLNEHFVSIKVDREERPDVDKIYMTAVQFMSGSGGWPLNCFLTPDRQPFYGGTYFPPEAKYGRPSFLQLLQNIHEVWTQRHGEVLSSAQDLTQRMSDLTQKEATNTLLHARVLTNAAEQFKAEFDAHHGGFGGAPKFPRPAQPAFLLRHGVKQHDQPAINMVMATCEKMANGGMNDQLGGGFARYSVDAKWLVPHFEKMLYDNAQLLQLYLDAHLVSGHDAPADIARDIIRYLLRDMTHPGGGFYSAEDADSEGHEGKFYCWTKKELGALLTVEEFNVAVDYFGITEEGNFVDHSHPTPLPGQNVLSIVGDLRPADRPLLDSAKKKMFETRSKRIRPHLDDKILASWNGLMLGGLARAGIVLDDPAYLAAAEKNLAFLQAKLWDAKTKTLYHRWRDGERDQAQLVDDYAFLLGGVLDLYEATLKPEHLEFALALAETMLAKFYDPERGGFWQSADGAGDLIMRVKEDYDGAEPSGNSVAILGLLRLGAICDRKDFRDAAEKSLRLFADRMQRLPHAVPFMLQALDFFLEEPKRVVIAGDASSPKARELLRAAHAVFQPRKVVLGTAGPVEAFAKTLPAKDGPVVYLCTGTACQPPTDDATKVKAMLK